MRAAAISWSRLASVLVTAMICAGIGGVGYSISQTPPSYTESAEVVFAAPKTLAMPIRYEWYAPSLITTGNSMSWLLTGPQAAAAINRAAGNAQYSLSMVNLNNADYPHYEYPLGTLSVTAHDPQATGRAFRATTAFLRRALAGRQAHMGVRRRYRVSAMFLGDTGPVSDAGSRLRVLAGIGLITAILAGLTRGLIARARRRLSVGMATPRPDEPHPAGAGAGAGPG